MVGSSQATVFIGLMVKLHVRVTSDQTGMSVGMVVMLGCPDDW